MQTLLKFIGLIVLCLASFSCKSQEVSIESARESIADTTFVNLKDYSTDLGNRFKSKVRSRSIKRIHT